MASLKDWTLEPIILEDGEYGGTKVKSTTVGSDEQQEYSYTFSRSLVGGNIPHPPFITDSSVKFLQKSCQFRDGDVFVCTYSKCGTTLCEQIVLLLQNDGDTSKLNPLHKNTFDKNSGIGKIWPEMAVSPDDVTNGNDKDNEACMGEHKARMSLTEFDSLKGARVLKSHAPQHLFLGNGQNGTLAKDVKVIYVTRNPFDACVSCYYHPKPGVSPESQGCSFTAFAKLWLSESIEFGGWINHVKGWREYFHRHLEDTKAKSLPQQILWMSYEDLVMEPKASIKKIAAFLDIDATSDLIERVMIGCKFDNVKHAAEKALNDGTAGNVSHLRKGKIGDWRNHFDDELKREFDEYLKKSFPEGLDYEYDIGDGQKWKVDALSKTVRLLDIKIIGTTVVFYSMLQLVLSYVYEFYADEKREESGLPTAMNFPVVSIVIANVFNGVSGGMAMATWIFSYNFLKQNLGPRGGYGNCVSKFLVSSFLESLITSGVMHSIGHRVFGSTFEGNAWVEILSHLGFTINVIFTGYFMIKWIGPKHLAFGTPKWYEILTSLAIATFAFLFAFVLVPFLPNPVDFDYPEGTSFNRDLIALLQGKIQPAIEAALLVPTTLMIFYFFRLWRSIGSAMCTSLEKTTIRVSILAVAIPLTLNWIHFRCHDDLVATIQNSFGWNHIQLIAGIRMIFHIPNWVLSVGRVHLIRRLAEEKASWPSCQISEVLYPGGDIFPFLMIFLYRASEGMTLSLLPSFFQGEQEDAKFYLDIVDNYWVAVTILAMFGANAVGALGLGRFMQKVGFRNSYIFIVASYALLLGLFMIPQSNASLLALRCIAALIFPGPVMLSRITMLTRHTYDGLFSFVPMVTALVWFNQGFWIGSAISNSSAWTSDWNIFFASAFILCMLATSLLIAFFVYEKRSKTNNIEKKSADEAELGKLLLRSNSKLRKESVEMESNLSDKSQTLDVIIPNKDECERDETNQLKTIPLIREKFASFMNGVSFAVHVSLLGIQITKLVDLDFYEYATIVGSLGTVSTILILVSFGFMSRQQGNMSLMTGNVCHILGTAILSIPNVYDIDRKSLVVFIIAISYALVLISFFVMNLACEVSLGQKSLKHNKLVGGKEMGNIKSALSVGKVLGSTLVVCTFQVHPQLPLWILEGLLVLFLCSFCWKK